MNARERRLLDRIHDADASSLTNEELEEALASRGGWPEDTLARGQAKTELEDRGAR